jgi:hypothetical protein
MSGEDTHQAGLFSDLELEGYVPTRGPVAGPMTTPPTAYAPAVASGNTFPIPLRKQNQATISFARMPLDKKDIDVLKSWIDPMEENLIIVKDCSDLIQ